MRKIVHAPSLRRSRSWLITRSVGNSRPFSRRSPHVVAMLIRFVRSGGLGACCRHMVQFYLGVVA